MMMMMMMIIMLLLLLLLLLSERDDMTLQLTSYKNYNYPKIYYAFRLKNSPVE